MDQIQVNASRPYEILFGPGSFEQLSVKLPEVCRSVRSACIVCDHTVAALYAARAEHLLRGLGYAVSRFSFSDTERANTTDIYERLVGHLHETQFDANGLLIAMGGTGVVQLVGFTAGTFAGTIQWISLPTTLSAMLEPISERYGLFMAGRMNAVSIVYPPVLSVCDPVFLHTLPDTHVRSGYAYIVKYSVSGFDAVTKSLPKLRDLRVPESGSAIELPSEETLRESIRAAAQSIRRTNDLGSDLAESMRSASSFAMSGGYATASALGVIAQLSVQSGYCDRKRYRYLTTRLMQFGLPTGTSFSGEELRRHLEVFSGEHSADKMIEVCVLKDIGCAVESMTAQEYEEKLRNALDSCKTICAGTVRTEDIYLPYSKELVLRMAFAWFLDGFSLLDLSEMPGDDIRAMDRCLHALLGGAEIPLDCGESATVLRLLLPLVGVLDIENVRFSLGAGLSMRPHESFLRLLRTHGMTVSVSKDKREFTVGGRLNPGEFTVTDRNAAEQICGLLFILPLLHGDSTVYVPDDIYRRNLIHLTINVLKATGVTVEIIDGGYRVPGEQKYDRFGLRGISPERDWSLAAVFKTLSYITGEDVSLAEMPQVSLQGEQTVMVYLDRLRDAVADGEPEVRIELGDFPNLIPCVALAASLTDGVTVTISGLDVLSDREGNRIQSIALVLATLGADISVVQVPAENTTSPKDSDVKESTSAEQDNAEPVKETAGGAVLPARDLFSTEYVIHGKGCLNGGIVDSMGDHRIAMMEAIAAWGCEQPVTVTDADVVERSFPGFFDELYKLI